MKKFVKVPSHVVRNEGVDIDSGTFMLYAKLCEMYFEEKSNKLSIDHTEVRKKLNVKDTRTFRKRLQSLYDNELLLGEFGRLPAHKPLEVVLNPNLFKKNIHFTMLDAPAYDYSMKIHETSYRLMYYYKSHINTSTDNLYCFAGRETITSKLHIGNTTFTDCNKELEDHGLLRVIRHKLGTEYEYDEEDKIVFTKFQNHYYLSDKLL